MSVMTKLAGSGSRRRRRRVRIPGLPLFAAVCVTLWLLAAAACGPDGVTSTDAVETTGETLPVSPSTSDGTSTTALTATTVSPSATVASTTTPSPSTTVPTSATTAEGLSSAETRLPNGRIRAMGFIDKVWESGGTRWIRIDYAEMLTGEEARAAAVQAGEIGPDEDLPNDYFIRNVNPQKREFRVSETAPITTATFGGGMEEPVTWSQFRSFWSSSPPAEGRHLKDMPWWIERDGDLVVSVSEQYLP